MSISKSSGLTIRRNQSFDRESLLRFATQGGRELLHWDFGPVMEMKYTQDAVNYLFSDECVPLHWDGAFFKEPRQLLFYCTESEGRGGETLFSNTELVWESLSAAEKKLCEQVTLTYRTQKKAHYGGEIKVPLVQKHPRTGKAILRMAEKVETKLNPVTLDISGVSDPEEFYGLMTAKLYDERHLVTHEWEVGDLVICDNFTFLHGRKALGLNKTRSFKRIQIL